jgi:predicted glycogen debranching enzyme
METWMTQTQEEASRIILEESVCSDYSKASRREWLEANGLGGFASGTVSGANTRRYHGLLVAALNPPVDRHVLLSKLEETLLIGGQRYELSSNQYRLVVHPQGYRFLKQFRLNPFPRWTYAVDGVELEKSVFMVHGEDTTVVRYRLLHQVPDHFAVLAVRPLIAFRNYHQLTSENESIRRKPELEEPGFLEIRPYDSLPAMRLYHNGIGFTVIPDWYRRFEYMEEQDRGLDYSEDLFTYGYLSYELSHKKPHAYLVATLRELPFLSLDEVDQMEAEERARRRKIVLDSSAGDQFAQQLVSAADSFIVKRADGATTIIAGYPWFTDWGRDAMISLPGLTLVTRRFERARDILSCFLKYCSQGMLPNRFSDTQGEAEYNSVDATLWLFHAVREYLCASEDVTFVREQAFPKLEEIIRYHKQGTRYNIHVDESDGLLAAGAEGVQLTWMDAKIANAVVTARQGKPVEVNALWHNALRVMEELCLRFKEREKHRDYHRLANRVQESFNEVYWNPNDNCLFDCVNGEFKDRKIRPNQIFAVSLPFPLLPLERARRVVKVVQEKLLTPYGLRSLAPEDPDYRKVYQGNQYERDSAYHQGTVWAWLIGPFVDAYLNAFGQSEITVRYLKSVLEPFRGHLLEAMVGSVSEIFDAEPPYRPRGCGAQAWSVAEVLRAYQRISD